MQALTLQLRSGRPCIKQLLRIAQRDSGGGRRIASVLLSLWSGSSFQCDLQGLLYLDGDRLQQILQILMLIAYLHQQGAQLDCLVSQEEMNPILDMWGPLCSQTCPSHLALFALAIQDALAGKPGAIVSSSTAHEMLLPVLGFYALGFAIAGNGPNRYFSHPGVNAGFVAFLFAYEKGDGVVLMTNGQHSKALGLEIIDALAKQYGWTEFPTESRFSNPWVIGLICASIILATYSLFRVVRRRKRSSI